MLDNAFKCFQSFQSNQNPDRFSPEEELPPWNNSEAEEVRKVPEGPNVQLRTIIQFNFNY